MSGGAAQRLRRWGLLSGAAVLLLVSLPLTVPLVLAPFARYPRAGGARDVRGAYHVHSVRSDGRGTDEEIARAAASAGLSFVVLTDHNLPSLPRPRFVEGVLLIYGTELSTPQGHLVALGLSRPLTEGERQSGAVARVLSLGGQPYLAHPVQAHWPWTDWDAAQGARGLELLSGDTFLRNALARPLRRALPALGAYLGRPLHGLYALAEDDPGARARLLALSSTGAPKVALCGLDAHGLPSYREVFRTLSMHLGDLGALPKDPEEAQRRVLAALADGDAYCGLDGLGDAAGFALRGATDRTARAGQVLEVELPGASAPTQLRVFGPAHAAADGRHVVLERPGVVEVEVFIEAPDTLLRPRWKPWIVTSPIRVTDGPPAP